MERHQLSAAFPDMPDEDFEDLIHSIKEHGQREPITVYENKILDGWHRYRACQQLDINPMTTVYEGLERAEVEYCTGQYWPTEYRRATCAVLASAIWFRLRDDVQGDDKAEAIRKAARRELSRPVAARWFR